MIFARPSDGFRWAQTGHSDRQLAEILNEYPQLKPYWNALKERLVFTGAREGMQILKSEESNAFFYSTKINGLPSIQVVYTILGETLTLQSVRVS